MKRLSEIGEMLKDAPVKTLALASAADEEVLKAVAAAKSKGFIRARLYGEAEAVKKALVNIGENVGEYEIIDITTPEDAVVAALKDIHAGKADIIMKGLMESGTFIKALINKEYGIKKPNSILSAMAAVNITVEGEERVLFISDPGFIPKPDLEMKKQILKNGVDVLHKLGIKRPKVAVLSASEAVNPKMESSVDAAKLQEMYENGEFEECDVCGPISIDLALSKHSAEHKNFKNAVAGAADLILVPNIETGNVLIKAIQYTSGAEIGGAIAGTNAPVVFSSRSDDARGKYNTIVMAILLSKENEND